MNTAFLRREYKNGQSFDLAFVVPFRDENKITRVNHLSSDWFSLKIQ